MAAGSAMAAARAPVRVSVAGTSCAPQRVKLPPNHPGKRRSKDRPLAAWKRKRRRRARGEPRQARAEGRPRPLASAPGRARTSLTTPVAEAGLLGLVYALVLPRRIERAPGIVTER